MDRKIVSLKYLGRLDVPDERDGHRDETVIEELLDLIERDKIVCEGWNTDHDFFIDNQADDDGILAEDETIVEVRMKVDLPEEDFYKDELPELLLSCVKNALLETDLNGIKVHPAHISNCHEREDGPFLKTVIEITIK